MWLRLGSILIFCLCLFGAITVNLTANMIYLELYNVTSGYYWVPETFTDDETLAAFSDEAAGNASAILGLS